MVAEPGLRERKKRQTRQLIFDASRRLFAQRGFDAVTVAEIAREADVSEVTVFNYFPTKEDLFYGGMQFFEEQLLEAVRTRARGETPVTALRRKLLESVDGLRAAERIGAIVSSAGMAAGSPSLAAREREIAERYVRRLAEVLAAETKADPTDVETLTVASALIGAHRAIVEETRRRVLEGRRGDDLVADTKAMIRRAYGRLERGLGSYAPRSHVPAGRPARPGGATATPSPSALP